MINNWSMGWKEGRQRRIKPTKEGLCVNTVDLTAKAAGINVAYVASVVKARKTAEVYKWEVKDGV